MKVTRLFLETIVKYGKNISSKDETRIFLNTVCIYMGKDYVTQLIATDGHKLIKSSHDVMGNVTCKFLFYTGDIPKLELFLKNHKLINKFDMTFKDNVMTLIFCDDILTFKGIEREYPDMAFTIGDDHKPKSIDSIAFYMRYIEDIRKAIYGNDKRVSNIIKFDLSCELSPMKAIATYMGIDHTVILMPMRK